MSNPNILDAALTRLDEAARHVQIDGDVLEKLKYPRETTKVRLLIRMDDGSRKSFLAWRCRYDDTRGPTKGGIRFHPDATAEEVETRAFWMTVKCAVTNLPYGGGKGGQRRGRDGVLFRMGAEPSGLLLDAGRGAQPPEEHHRGRGATWSGASPRTRG